MEKCKIDIKVKQKHYETYSTHPVEEIENKFINMRNQWSEAGFLDKCTITYDAVGIIGAHIKYSNKAMIIRMGNYDIFR